MLNLYASCNGFSDCISGITTPGLTYTTDQGLVAKIIGDVLPVVLGIAGFLTVIFIVVSGIQFITSSGNPEAAAGARSRLIYALVGFIIIVLSFAILQIVNFLFLGSNIT